MLDIGRDALRGVLRARALGAAAILCIGLGAAATTTVAARDAGGANEALPRRARDRMMGVAVMTADRIVSFYRHETADDRGRTLRDIWTWDHERLEGVHDFIQWLFPLREPSMFNYTAPLVTAGTVAAFAGDSTLRDNLTRSLELMLDFYGLSMENRDGGVAIVPGASFEERGRNWLTPGNHNHLRLTRILTSTRLLGLAAYSSALFERLAAIYEDHRDAISPVTFDYWRHTAR